MRLSFGITLSAEADEFFESMNVLAEQNASSNSVHSICIDRAGQYRTPDTTKPLISGALAAL